VIQNRIASKDNLHYRGIDVGSRTSVMCQISEETVTHSNKESVGYV